MRSAASLAAEIEMLKERMQNLANKSKRLRDEHNLAAIREAEGKHPWIGMKVRQEITRGFRRQKTMRRGVLTIYDRDKHRSLRELYNAEPGDLFVLTAGGQTGYRFYTDEEVDRINAYRGGGRDIEQKWELDQ